MKIVKTLSRVLAALCRKASRIARYLVPVYLIWRTDSSSQILAVAPVGDSTARLQPAVTRKINEIIVHCTASPAGRNLTVNEIRNYHVNVNGWDDIGYHFIICLDGTIAEGRPVNIQGAHCRGHNELTIGIAYVGGLMADGKTPADTRTPEQRRALTELIARLVNQFRITRISSHSDYAAKACPCFNAAAEYSHLLKL